MPEGHNQLFPHTLAHLPATPTTQPCQEQGLSNTVIIPSQIITASKGHSLIMSSLLYSGSLFSALSSPTNNLPSSFVSMGQSLPLLWRTTIQQNKLGEYIDFLNLQLAKRRQLTPTIYNSKLVFV